MASKARVVVASEQGSKLIDKGFRTNKQMKGKEKEDSGIKAELVRQFQGALGTDSSICVKGIVGMAVLTRVEKMEIAANADVEDLSVVRNAINKGLFDGALNIKQVLNVPVADRERAAEELQKCGIDATVSTSISIDSTDELRVALGSAAESEEEQEAVDVLNDVVERSESFRVKYESINE